MDLSRRGFGVGATVFSWSLGATANSQTAGAYHGRPVLLFLDDGRTAELMEPFGFVDPQGLAWEVPTGARVDGASIPRALWSITGGPFEGKYRNASIIHDWYCDVRVRTWESTHRVFHAAMLVSGVSKREADRLYGAVRRFGPRWNETAIYNIQRLSETDKASVARAAPLGLTTDAAGEAATAAIGAVVSVHYDLFGPMAASGDNTWAGTLGFYSTRVIEAGEQQRLFQAYSTPGLETFAGIVGRAPSGGLTLQIEQWRIAADDEVVAFVDALPTGDLDLETIDRLADAH